MTAACSKVVLISPTSSKYEKQIGSLMFQASLDIEIV